MVVRREGESDIFKIVGEVFQHQSGPFLENESSESAIGIGKNSRVLRMAFDQRTGGPLCIAVP